MALKDTIAMMGEIDATKHSNYLDEYIPILIEDAERYCHTRFDKENPPAGVKIFIAESIRHKLNTKGLKSRTMGSVSYTYDTDLPNNLYKSLKTYRKVAF